jgi:hypothetical protein
MNIELFIMEKNTFIYDFIFLHLTLKYEL